VNAAAAAAETAEAGLDPIVRGLLDRMAAEAMPKLWRLPPDEGRALYRGLGRMLEPQDLAIAAIRDETIMGPGGGALTLRVYTPVGAGSGALPGILFIHGGGWVLGDLDSHDALCRRLANEAGARLVSVDYRLAPEHRFPAAVEDCYAAACWIGENASALGIDPERIAVAGDSAGGNLAAVTCLISKQRSGPRFIFQLLIYPVTRAMADTESMRVFAEGYFLEEDALLCFLDHYAPGADPDDWRISPLAAPSLEGLPPACIVTAGFDPLKDEGKAYAERLARSGVQAVHVDFPSMIHGFFNMSGAVPMARTAIAEAAGALRRAFEQTGRPRRASGPARSEEDRDGDQ
jgi:acetyl esterase